MSTTYVVTLHRRPPATLQIEVPDTVDPLGHLADDIADVLGIRHYEIEIGFHGGTIRRQGDAGPGTAFTLTETTRPQENP